MFGTKTMLIDTPLQHPSINTPLFDAVFAAKEKQAAAGAGAVEQLKALEEKARAEGGKKQLDAFVCVVVSRNGRGWCSCLPVSMGEGGEEV